MTLLNSCQVLKSLACIVVAPQLIAQLNRFLALQALVEGLGIWSATFGLKFPILLNWVKLRPGIWDGGAISSTVWGVARAPTWGCLGLAPNRWSKQCGMDITCDLGGILVYDIKIRDGGQRMVEILTMFKYGRGCGLGVFFDPLAKGPRSFSNVGGVAPICLAFPMVD